MKRTRTTAFWRALPIIIGLSLPTTYAVAAENVDILQKVQSAKTAADYEALASYYDSQAAEAKKKADVHREMAKSFTGGGTPIGKGASAPLPQHCLALVKTYEDEAAHDAAMAETYRKLAQSMK